MKEIVDQFKGCLIADNFDIPGHSFEWKRVAKKAEAKNHVLTVFEIPIINGYPDSELILQIQTLITNFNPLHYEGIE